MLDKDDDIVDRDFRFFVEECDCMQGIQVFIGFDDVWGGFVGEYVEVLRDEYGKSCVWVWGVQSFVVGVQREKRRLRMVNMVQSLNRLCFFVLMVVFMFLLIGCLLSGINFDVLLLWYLLVLFLVGFESVILFFWLMVQLG